MVEALGWFRAGGWMMAPLLVVGLAVAYLACERIAYVWRATRIRPGAASRFWGAGRSAFAANGAEEGALERILAYTFDGPASGRQSRFREAVTAELEALGDRVGLLGALVAVAPLLGLLGTVAGMIDTFDTLRVLGTGSPQELSRGIYQALFTTQLGLAVALPGLSAHQWLVRQKRRFELELARVERELAPAFAEEC